VPINPYGKAKKMAEDIIKDYAAKDKQMAVTILRLVTSVTESLVLLSRQSSNQVFKA
jgi:UDP-glucose 4-epimerase